MAADDPGEPAPRGQDTGPGQHGPAEGAPGPREQASNSQDDGAGRQDATAAAAAPVGFTPGERLARSRTGRNLPVAVGVGLGMGALAILTLLTVKATFLLYVGVIVGMALWELARALEVRGIRLPVVPVAAGGAAAFVLAYWEGERAIVASLVLTLIAILAWRLPSGAAGYLRDVTAGVFALAYLPLLACFVSLMLAPPDGSRRTLIFLILTVCSDVGGYFAGIMLGHHPMAPVISPKKTWEGLGGSAFACVLGGAIALPTMLHGAIWQGILVGLAALAAATLGDLAESMMKRDLEIKDMGTLLPGHGGILDRIDSHLMVAPTVWVLLLIFIPVAHH